MRQVGLCILVLLAIAVCALALFSRRESISWMPYVSSQRSCRIGFYSTDLCVIWIEQKKGSPSFGVTDEYQLWPLPVQVTHSEWLMAQQGVRRSGVSVSAGGSNPLLSLLADLGGMSAPPVPRAFAVTYVRTPFWLPVVVLLALPAGLAVVRTIRRYRRTRRGECRRCGYDLTGNETGTCPECGSTPKPGSTSQSLGSFDMMDERNGRSTHHDSSLQ